MVVVVGFRYRGIGTEKRGKVRERKSEKEREGEMVGVVGCRYIGLTACWG